MKKFFSWFSVSFLICFQLNALAESAYRDLAWEDLIPEGYVMEDPLEALSDDEFNNLMDGTEEAIQLMSEIQVIRDNTPVVTGLNGQTIRLPGFVVPLDFEAEKVHEFLLVPFFGACIHVPPPPANQTVFVKSQEGIKIEQLFDAVYVVGMMETTAVSSELGQAGYTLHAEDVYHYEEQQTLQ